MNKKKDKDKDKVSESERKKEEDELDKLNEKWIKELDKNDELY